MCSLSNRQRCLKRYLIKVNIRIYSYSTTFMSINCQEYAAIVNNIVSYIQKETHTHYHDISYNIIYHMFVICFDREFDEAIILEF